MLDIIKAPAKKNLCYIAAQRMVPAGIVVHSTGANNPWLKRYVDCPGEVGVNQYGNHWNTAKPGGQKMCVHAFIGYDKNKKIRVAEILPLDICCWGVGSGSKGSYNYNPAYIQFEICEDGLTDETYYRAVFDVAAEYCAYLCRTYGLRIESVVGHIEAHRKGYGSSHADPEHWMKRFGETMDDFRARVDEKLGKESEAETPRSVQKGDLVVLSRDACYFSGKPIPQWVKAQKWYVKEAQENGRVVIDRNEAGTNAICSPVHEKDLTLVRRCSV